MAMAFELTSAITNPLHPSVMQAVLGGDVMLGNDPNCSKWITKFREPVSKVKSTSNRRKRLKDIEN